MKFRLFYSVLWMLMFSMSTHHLWAQKSKILMDFQKEKPEQFKNRKLRSEKTGEKKFGVINRFLQNTTSHYNYYFNADGKIKSIIESGRIAQKDDYNKLLPYYSYSLDYTASRKTDLDSVIQKSTAGILLHDLRSNWVDNFYLLIGKAYFLEKKFDSAYMAFQFINFNLRPSGKDDQQDHGAIGSNLKTGSHIATPEDRNLTDRMLTLPPSRNDALIWQVRTFIELGLYGEASGLINTLRNDSQFPERLKADLNDVIGYWFYNQEMFDSTIRYIKLSMPNTADNQERARREFLLAQLYENEKKIDTADYYYQLAQKHATDPLLDIYASLRRVKLFDKSDAQNIRDGIDRLLKMSRRDKYYDYRHIIYYSAGQLAMDIPDSLSAVSYFIRSAHLNINDPNLKGKTWLTLAQLNYGLGNYQDALNCYDSLTQTGIITDNAQEINRIKTNLTRIVGLIDLINQEDSLRQIALLPESEREAYLKKLSRRLEKERGIRDDQSISDSNLPGMSDKINQATDMFSQNSSKGGWYFNNASVRAQGFSEFKRIWGNRQNTDNWRTGTSQTLAGRSPGNPAARSMTPGNDPNTLDSSGETDAGEHAPDDISVGGLRAGLPLTEAQLDQSNKKITRALFDLGKEYQMSLEDYRSAASTYEESLKRFPEELHDGELYLNLSFCYKKLGNTALEDKYQRLLINSFPDSKSAAYLTHPQDRNPSLQKDSAASRMYDTIYGLFIQGDFDQALSSKKIADSLYGDFNRTPQLLYIEAMYYIRQREDSTAISILNTMMKKYPDSSLNKKAANLIQTVKRRKEIEEYLTNLEVERLPEDSVITVFDDTRIYGNINQPQKRNDSNLLSKKITPVNAPELKADKKLPAPITGKSFTLDPYSTQRVVMMLTNVDPIYSSEARRALAQYAKSQRSNQKIEVVNDTLDTHRTMLIFSDFVSGEEAVRFIQKLKKDVPRELSWLPANTYSFYFISGDNLQLLKENKKLDDYLNLLRQKFPDIF